MKVTDTLANSQSSVSRLLPQCQKVTGADDKNVSVECNPVQRKNGQDHLDSGVS